MQVEKQDKIGNYRWRIVVLLFFATTINYIDRQVLGILAPQLQQQFGWSESDYGFIIMAFQIAYAVGLISMGTLLDKIGTRLGFIIAISLWSLAGMAHAAARSVFSFSLARFALGIGESANFPAAVKTVAEWFPKKERALATGIFNSGPNVGAILTPLLIPVIALELGWEWGFIITGALGFIWLLFWIPMYRKPELDKRLSDAERRHILQDDTEPDATKLPWKSIISYKQTWGICLARFLTDPIWWFFLYWLPKFLNSNHNIDLTNIGLPLIIIYMVSIGGSIFGGWMSSFLINRGKNPVAARILTIFLLALLVVPIFFASFTSSLWLAVALISMATFAHQGYAANIFTIVSDIFPKSAVGSVVGLSGFAGAIGGVLFSGAVGVILEITGSYYVIFGIASVAYLLCWLSLQLLVPAHQKIQLPQI
ncbi:MFS transporter [Gaoshiqia sediminis]|uniref:MFS transporter n=1 Tax=Gaoshiqia sediminis TaxID=2986998 RepID=A0AA42C5R5_9BACT|nr:MFS transporter [Gaoshiqia sediminis]MCW0481819.1 MFS transporter [Gaoshiqia sediminis]